MFCLQLALLPSSGHKIHYSSFKDHFDRTSVADIKAKVNGQRKSCFIKCQETFKCLSNLLLTVFRSIRLK